MADYKYAYNGPENGIAKAVLKDAPISTKTAIEMCSFLRGKNTEAAKATLERVLIHTQAVPFKRFTNGLGHKPGIAAGRYPEKASKAFLQLIQVVEANASQKGLAADLIITHLVAHKASTPFHFGRQRRRKTKRTHVEIVVKEAEGAKRKTAKKQSQKAAKQEATAAPQQQEEKPAVKQEKPAAKRSEAKPPATPKKRPAKEASQQPSPAQKENDQP